MKQKRVKKIGWYRPSERGAYTRDTYDGLPEAHLAKFRSELDRLRARFFEKDEDEDFPVTVNVVDLTRTMNNFYTPLPHLHKRVSADALRDALRDAIGNVRQAADDLRMLDYSISKALRDDNDKDDNDKEQLSEARGRLARCGVPARTS